MRLQEISLFMQDFFFLWQLSVCVLLQNLEAGPRIGKALCHTFYPKPKPFYVCYFDNAIYVFTYAYICKYVYINFPRRFIYLGSISRVSERQDWNVKCQFPMCVFKINFPLREILGYTVLSNIHSEFERVAFPLWPAELLDWINIAFIDMLLLESSSHVFGELI